LSLPGKRVQGAYHRPWEEEQEGSTHPGGAG